MPAPVSWLGTPTSLWASFPGGVGAPNVPIPLRGGAKRSSSSHSRHRSSRSSRHRSHKKSRKSMRRCRQTRRR